VNRCVCRCDEGETTPEAAMFGRRFVLIATIVCAVGALTGGSALLLWPEADNWTEEAKACVGDKYVGFWQDNGKYSFKMDFENNCARKIACGIDVTVSNAKGSVKDHGTVIIPARGQTPSEASYSIPTSSSSGMAQTARNCRFV
jgi:hypothetical protein